MSWLPPVASDFRGAKKPSARFWAGVGASGQPPDTDVVGEVKHDALGPHAERGGDELRVDRVDQVSQVGAAH
jgi:hypothetical protein